MQTVKSPPPFKQMQEKSSEGMTVDLKSDKKGGHGDRENGQERDHPQAWPGLDLDCGFLKKRQKKRASSDPDNRSLLGCRKLHPRLGCCGAHGVAPNSELLVKRDNWGLPCVSCSVF